MSQQTEILDELKIAGAAYIRHQATYPDTIIFYKGRVFLAHLAIPSNLGLAARDIARDAGCEIYHLKSREDARSMLGAARYDVKSLDEYLERNQ